MESLHMNWLDYTLIGLVLLSTVGGAIRGFLKEVLPLVSLVLGLFIAYRVSPELQSYVLHWWANDTMAYVFCFVVVFVLAWILLSLLSGLLYKLVKTSAAGHLDRLLGGFLGLVRGVVVAVLIAVSILAFLPPDHAALRGSALAPSALYIGRLAVSLMPEEQREELERRYEDLLGKTRHPRGVPRSAHPNSV